MLAMEVAGSWHPGDGVGKILMQAFAIPESGELPGNVKAVGVWMSYSVH